MNGNGDYLSLYYIAASWLTCVLVYESTTIQIALSWLIASSYTVLIMRAFKWMLLIYLV